MFLSLDSEKIMKEYSFAIRKLKEWFKAKSTVGQELDEEYRKQLDEAISDDYIIQVLRFNPRLLYDFFDDQNLFCSTFFDVELNSWQYFAHPSANVGAFASTRQGAEIQLFESAFLTLEAKLRAENYMKLP
jgi:hypothetical protein